MFLKIKVAWFNSNYGDILVGFFDVTSLRTYKTTFKLAVINVN